MFWCCLFEPALWGGGWKVDHEQLGGQNGMGDGLVV
jgi:hypothetical protein